MARLTGLVADGASVFDDQISAVANVDPSQMGRHREHVGARVRGRSRHRPLDATAWLSKHGAHYGLCQIYRNEFWHYELRAEAARRGCTPMHSDPTHDPRMQQ